MPVVTNVHPLTGHSREDVLRMAGSAEMLSEHPIGAAIIAMAKEEGIALETPEKFFALAGTWNTGQFRSGKSFRDNLYRQ